MSVGAGVQNDTIVRSTRGMDQIDQSAFVVIAGLLQEAMEEHGMAPADVRTVVGDFSSREHLVVTR